MTVADQNDQEFDSGNTPIKDRTEDMEKLVGEKLEKGVKKDAGWNAKRMTIIGTCTEGGVRHIERDKEYNFRPKSAKFVHDSVIYRDFSEPPKKAEPDDAATGMVEGDSVASGIGGGTGVVSGAPPGSSGGGGGTSVAGEAESGKTTKVKPVHSWIGSPQQFGVEIGWISDITNPLKTEPGHNPSSYNGKNHSTLIHSQQELYERDKNRDLPRRYFGRAHDTTVIRQTQDVEYSRKIYKNSTGGSAAAPPPTPPGAQGQNVTVGGTFGGGNEAKSGADSVKIHIADRARNPGKFFYKEEETQKYKDPVWKAMWNITPEDDGYSDATKAYIGSACKVGKGADGYGPHYYSGAQEDPGDLKNLPKKFQGGWMCDLKWNTQGQISDVLEIGFTNKENIYTRYKTTDGEQIGLVYLRHDAIWGKSPSEAGRIHFLGKGSAEEPSGDDYWADVYLDTNMKGQSSALGHHETGQWRVIYKIKENPGIPNGDTPVKDPVDDGPPDGGTDVPTGARISGDGNTTTGTPTESPPCTPGGHYFEPGERVGGGTAFSIPRDFQAADIPAKGDNCIVSEWEVMVTNARFWNGVEPGSGQQLRLAANWKTHNKCSPMVASWNQQAALVDSTKLTVDQVALMRFVIPPDSNVKAGSLVDFAFFRTGDHIFDNYVGNFYVMSKQVLVSQWKEDQTATPIWTICGTSII